MGTLYIDFNANFGYCLSMSKFLIILVFGLLISTKLYAEDNLTVNNLLKEGFKITKEELIKRNEGISSMKILTLKKGNSGFAICSIYISRINISKANCIKP